MYPRLFSLYCGGISNVLKIQMGSDRVHFLSYPDDSYVVIQDTSMTNLKKNIARTSKSHVEYLKSLVMKVNESKTEVVIFSRKGGLETDVDIAGASICTKSEMTVLGLTLDENLVIGNKE